MTRNTGRLLALFVTLGLALAGYFIQPANLLLFSNPTSAGILLGAAMVGLGILNNWLPSILNQEPPKPTPDA